MKKHLIVAGFFASFALIVVYFMLYFAGDGRAWWMALAVGGAVLLTLTPLFFLSGLCRAARFDAFEKTMTAPFLHRFALSFCEKGVVYADARLYILKDALLFVAFRGKATVSRRILPDAVTDFNLNGEDVAVYLKTGEMLALETGEGEELTEALQSWVISADRSASSSTAEQAD